jgi:tellurite resistance protein TehA-like permease
MSWSRAVQRAVRAFYPGYFAAVMATGVLSIALWQRGDDTLAAALFHVTQAAYVLCWLLTAARAIWFRHALAADFIHHATSPSFLTAVAATCVLGSQYVLLDGARSVGAGLWIFAVIQWFVLLYGFLGAVMIGVAKPSLERGISGAWLVPVVATQSLALLAALLAPGAGALEPTLAFVALAALLLGCMLYALIVTLIFYRLTFIRFTAHEFTPEYWIDMGAEASTTMAGATIIMHAGYGALVQMQPFLDGLTIFFWVAGTWWIPLLVVLAVWRYGYGRVPVHYDPRYWGAVFPLAMYTASTFQLARATHFAFLYSIAHVFIYLAGIAWLAVAASLVRTLLLALTTPPVDTAPEPPATVA